MDLHIARSSQERGQRTTRRLMQRRHKASIGNQPHYFANYISFGVNGTLCLLLFFLLYILVLVITLPLLSLKNQPTDNNRLPDLHLKRPLNKIKSEFIKHDIHVPGQEKISSMAKRAADKLTEKYHNMKKKISTKDKSLTDLAIDEYKKLRQTKEKKRKQQQQDYGTISELVANNTNAKIANIANNVLIDNNNKSSVENVSKDSKENANDTSNDNKGREIVAENKNDTLVVKTEDPEPIGGTLIQNYKRSGVIVLGMHRSGTSMLCGLLVTGAGYEVGGPLVKTNFDNKKGFYERLDVVLQNDEFMKPQNVYWNSNVIAYNSDKALADLKAKEVPFDRYGKPAIEFLNSVNDQSNIPWLQKDPRMCITIKTWLPLLNKEPAVVYTYRNPMEVAMSLVRREQNFSLEHGLRLWIIYNMRGIQNSRGLCMVHTSNDEILSNPMKEIRRIIDELTTKCNLPPPPKPSISQDNVDGFIDPDLQHNKKKEEQKVGEIYLEQFDDGCNIPDFERSNNADKWSLIREEQLYKIAMRMDCDFKNGNIYKDDYQWPKLP